MSEQRVVIDLNPREQRLWDRVRARVVTPVPRAQSSMGDMLVLLPDLTVLLARLLRDNRVPLGSKLLALAGVGYVLSPIDLLPTFLFGPIGLVDDLVVVSAALSRLLNDVHPDVVRSHWSGKGDALDAIRRTSGWSENLFRVRFVGLVRRVFRT
jgi:uncharacterized membrane protein YkvA (DUF1232 family)